MPTDSGPGRSWETVRIMRAIRILNWLLPKLNLPVLPWIKDKYDEVIRLADTSHQIYEERAVPYLECIFRDMSPLQVDTILYGNPRDRMARDACNWYEDAFAEENKRQETLRQDEERRKLRDAAMAKLTAEERSAIGM